MIAGGKARSAHGRQRLDRVFVWCCLAATSLSCVILGVLVLSILREGMKHLDGEFLTNFASRFPAKAGFSAALWGSVWACLICVIAAVPLGVGTAILLEEYKPKNRVLGRLHELFQLNVGNLAGVPSVVYGILGLTVFARMLGLFGGSNISTYDRMEVLRLRDQPSIQVFVREEVLDSANEKIVALRVSEPVAGDREIPIGDVRSRRVIFADEFRFELNDGREARGRLLSAEGGAIRVFTANREEIAFNASEVRSWRTHNMVSFGDPDAWYHLRLPLGGSVLAGGLTLALVVLPIVIISTREALRAVPDSLRQGALAIGATKWQMVSRMILPCAVPGIMTGSILAVSRAIGEAAPLLVVSGVVFILYRPSNVMSDFTVMPLQIFNWASMPQEEFHKVAASGIIVLMGVLLVFNAAAIVIRQKLQKPLQ